MEKITDLLTYVRRSTSDRSTWWIRQEGYYDDHGTDVDVVDSLSSLPLLPPQQRHSDNYSPVDVGTFENEDSFYSCNDGYNRGATRGLDPNGSFSSPDKKYCAKHNNGKIVITSKVQTPSDRNKGALYEIELDGEVKRAHGSPSAGDVYVIARALSHDGKTVAISLNKGPTKFYQYIDRNEVKTFHRKFTKEHPNAVQSATGTSRNKNSNGRNVDMDMDEEDDSKNSSITTLSTDITDDTIGASTEYRSVQMLKFSPGDSSFIAVGLKGWNSRDIVIIYNISNKYTFREFDQSADDAIAFSSDGALIAFGTSDRGVIVYKACDGKEYKRFGKLGTRVSKICFSPCGISLAFSSEESIFIFNMCTDEEVLNHQITNATSVEDLYFDKDHRTIVYVGKGNDMNEPEHINVYDNKQHCLHDLLTDYGKESDREDKRSIKKAIMRKTAKLYNGSNENNKKRTSSLYFNSEGNCFIHEAAKKNLPEVVAQIININTAHALIPFSDKSENPLNLLEKRKYVHDLHQFFSTHQFQAVVDERCLEVIQNIVKKLCKSQLSDTLVKVLTAGERTQCLPGFVLQNRTYLESNKKRGPILTKLPSLIKCILCHEQKIEPLAFDFDMPKPRNSGNKHDFNIFFPSGEPYQYDEKKQVRLQIIRVLLPNLASFESLKALTLMHSRSPFDTLSIGAVLDGHWFGWARKRFIILSMLYIYWLVLFTVLCENRHQLRQDYGGIPPMSKIDITLAVAVCLGIAFFGTIEILRYRLLREVHFKKGWSYFHMISLSMTVVYLILEHTIATTQVVAHFSAFSQLMSWLVLLYYLRGSNALAWIISALSRIMVEMIPFFIVLFVIVMMFAVAFEALSKHATGIGGWFTSIANTFYASMLSEYDIEYYDEVSYSPMSTEILLSFMLIIISVISLNALIALISDAFERVLAEKYAVLNGERAQLILDMYTTMTHRGRREIEEKNKWTYRLIPFSSLETMRIDSDSTKANLARATKDDLLRTNRQLKGTIKNELEETKTALAKQIKKEIKEELMNQFNDDFDNLKKFIVEQQEGTKLSDDRVTKNELKTELQSILQAIHSLPRDGD